MLWTTHGYGWYELLRISWAQSTKFYEQFKVMDDMNDSWLGDYDFKGYEQLRAMDDMNNSKSWAKGSKYYEQLKAMYDKNDTRSWA